MWCSNRTKESWWAHHTCRISQLSRLKTTASAEFQLTVACGNSSPLSFGLSVFFKRSWESEFICAIAWYMSLSKTLSQINKSCVQASQIIGWLINNLCRGHNHIWVKHEISQHWILWGIEKHYGKDTRSRVHTYTHTPNTIPWLGNITECKVPAESLYLFLPKNKGITPGYCPVTQCPLLTSTSKTHSPHHRCSHSSPRAHY